MPPAVFTPVLIGRVEQMRQLEEQLSLAERGRGSLVVIAGDTGIGKSRLLQEFLRRVRAAGRFEVLEGRGYEGDRGTTFGPLAEALTSSLRRGQAKDASARSSRAGWEAALREMRRGQADRPALEAVREALRPAVGDKPRLVALEDLHWADPATLESLRFLARGIGQDRLLAVGTYRTDELRRGHLLAEWSAQLTADRLLQEARIEPLGRDELAMMVEAILGQPGAPRWTSALHDRTGGNPLFVEELIRRWIERDGAEAVRLAARDGEMAAGEDMPPAVKVGAIRRLDQLEPAARSIAHAAAVIGCGFDFDLLHRVVGGEEPGLVRALADMVDGCLIREVEGEPDHFRFRNVLLREAIYDDLLGREKRRLHQAVLAALESDPTAAAGRAAALAYHSLQAREPEKGYRYSLQAGDLASERHAYAEAVAQYRAALALAEAVPNGDRPGLLTRLGGAAYPLGDTRQTQRYWEEARRLYLDLGERERAAQLDLKLSSVIWASGDHAGALERVQAALQVLETLPPSTELGMAYSRLSQLSMLSSQPVESLRWAEKALALADRLGDDRVRAHATTNIGTCMAESGDLDRGIRLLEESLALCRTLRWVEEIARACNNLGVLLAIAGDLRRAAEVQANGLETLEKHGWDLGRGHLQSNLGVLFFLLGEWDRAQQLLDHAIRAGESGFPVARLNGLPRRAEIELRRGRATLALTWLESIRPEADRLGEFQHLREVYPVLASCLWALGRAPEAIQAADHVVERWRAFQGQQGAVPMLGEVADLYLTAGELERAGELVTALEAAVERMPTPRGRAWLAESRGLADLARGQAKTAESFFREAGAEWQSMGMAYHAARSSVRRAQAVLAAGGRDGRAAADLATARDTFERLGAKPDLEALRQLNERFGLSQPAAPLPERLSASSLTPREREVLPLLAQGMTNRQIARELVISVKTAEIHVSNILAKLGLSSRAQVAARLSQEIGGEEPRWVPTDRPRPGSRVS